MNRADNLKPFKPGQSGNPKGRPRKLAKLDDLLDEVLGANEDSDHAKAILIAIRRKAKRGDVRAAELLLDRAFGKPKQSFDHTSEGNKISGFTLVVRPEQENK